MEYNANGIHIAPCDKEAIDKLVSSGEWRWDENKLIKCKKSKEEKIIEFNYLPQPYMGDPEQAEIFLLNGNPDAKEGPTVLSHEEFNNDHKGDILRSLKNMEEEYPLYALNPHFNDYYIQKWWNKKLCHLWKDAKSQKDIQTAIQTVSKKVFVAEYFPYFSKNFNDVKDIELDSQRYTFSLVKEAMDAGKKIIIMRAKKMWCNAMKKFYDIQNLEDYSHKLKNPRNVCISRGNMEDGVFNDILKLLKGETP